MFKLRLCNANVAQCNREWTILNTIAHSLNGSADLAGALAVELEQITAHFDLQTRWIWLLDELEGATYLAASLNLPPALADDPRGMEGDCYCLHTFRRGDLWQAAKVNAVICSRLDGRVKGTERLRHHANVPLYVQEKKLGMLYVISSDCRSCRWGICACYRRSAICSGSRLSAPVCTIKSVEAGAVEETQSARTRDPRHARSEPGGGIDETRSDRRVVRGGCQARNGHPFAGAWFSHTVNYVERNWPLAYYQAVFASGPGSAKMLSAGRTFTAELIT